MCYSTGKERKSGGNTYVHPIRNLLDKRQELSDQIEQMEQEKTAIEQQVKLQMQYSKNVSSRRFTIIHAA